VLVLGLDTATWFASVGLVRDGSVLAEESCRVRTGHTDILLPLVRQLVSRAGVGLTELDGIGVSIGPGSFSGLRVGLNTAKGLCYALGLALVGVSTLEALATTVGDWQGRICVLLDARRKEVYAAVFVHGPQRRLRRLTPDMVLAPDDLWSHISPPCLFIGDGAEAYRGLIRDRYGDAVRFVSWASCHPSGAAVARLALPRLRAGESDDVSKLVPRYVRLSEAERKRRQAP
jgi:tRNA threonylcarbamoyladenosine biosynthesis protein TsaB